jgi:hypothetical protein
MPRLRVLLCLVSLSLGPASVALAARPVMVREVEVHGKTSADMSIAMNRAMWRVLEAHRAHRNWFQPPGFDFGWHRDTFTGQDWVRKTTFRISNANWRLRFALRRQGFHEQKAP